MIVSSVDGFIVVVAILVVVAITAGTVNGECNVVAAGAACK